MNMRLLRFAVNMMADPAADPGGGGGDPPPAAPPADPAAPPADPPPGDPPAAPPADPPPAGNLVDFNSLPEDWRTQLGKDVEGSEPYLARLSNLPALVKNYVSAQERIRKGEIGNGLPENPTDEQMVKWREANNVPVSADKYGESLTPGLVLDENQEKVFGAVYEQAFEGNVPAPVVAAMIEASVKVNLDIAHEREIKDGFQRGETLNQLKGVWAGDYGVNMDMSKAFINRMPEELRKNIVNARLPDGTALFNDGNFMVYIADIERQLNPQATVVPNANNPAQAINDEIATLEGRMADDDWHKDVAANKRLDALYEAQERMQAKHTA